MCSDGLVGRTAADRDRGHDKKNTLPEAKKCYSSQCLEMCASVLAVSQLQLLMDPVKKVRLTRQHGKITHRFTPYHALIYLTAGEATQSCFDTLQLLVYLIACCCNLVA